MHRLLRAYGRGSLINLLIRMSGSSGRVLYWGWDLGWDGLSFNEPSRYGQEPAW